MRRVLPKRSSPGTKTPRFLYPLALLAFASWGGWGYILFFVSPDSLLEQALFLLTLFLALFFTGTFLLYEITTLIKGGKPNELFYPAARRAFFLSSYLSLSGAMVIAEVANTINLVLFGLILILTEVQLSRRR
jgi:hypothetical protein